MTSVLGEPAGPAAANRPSGRNGRARLAPSDPSARLRFRRIPPVDSPLPGRVVAAACVPGSDARPQLARLVEDQYHADQALLCDSGTSALRVALESCIAATSGAPISIPAFACYDVGTAALGAEATVLFHDVDPDSLSPDLASLEADLQRGARTVVVVHPFGIPVDWQGVTALAERYRALVIEDAAQAHGGVLNGRPLGSLGALSVLSFGRGKGWTGAGGGALLARGAGPGLIAEAAQRLSGLAAGGGGLRTLVSAAGHSMLRHPSRYWVPAALPWLHLGETVFHPPTPLQAMTRMSARIALATHTPADDSVSVRRRHAQRYRESLRGVRGAQPVSVPDGASPGLIRFPVRLRGGIQAFPDVEAARRLGVESTYPTPLPALRPLARLALAPDAVHPGASALVREMVTLPTHQQVKDSDIARIVEMVAVAAEASAGVGG